MFTLFISISITQFKFQKYECKIQIKYKSITWCTQ